MCDLECRDLLGGMGHLGVWNLMEGWLGIWEGLQVFGLAPRGM